MQIRSDNWMQWSVGTMMPHPCQWTQWGAVLERWCHILTNERNGAQCWNNDGTSLPMNAMGHSVSRLSCSPWVPVLLSAPVKKRAGVITIEERSRSNCWVCLPCFTLTPALKTQGREHFMVKQSHLLLQLAKAPHNVYQVPCTGHLLHIYFYHSADLWSIQRHTTSN